MKNILIAFMIFIPTLGLAYTCPNLAGTYKCPGNSGYPDFKLIITETLNADRSYAEYIYDYPELGFPPLTVYASSKGELNQSERPYWGQCFKDTLIYFKQDSTAGSFQTTAISATGELEVYVRGVEAARCPKIQTRP